MAIVGEGAGTLHDHVTDLGQGLAPLSARQRADGAHVAEVGGTRTVDLVADAGPRVSHGIRVGHRRHVGEASVDCGAAAGLDGLLVLEAWVAEVDVHVDEAGNEVLARGVDDLDAIGGRQPRAHLDDVASLHEDVGHAVQADLWIHGMGALKQKCHCSLLPEAGTSRPCG